MRLGAARRFLLGWRGWVVCLLVALVPVQVFAQVDADHVLSRAVLRDVTGQMTVQDMAGATFTPEDGVFAGGYSSDVIWMRLVIRASAAGEALVMRVLPAYLNEVTLYEPEPAMPGQWRTQVTGNDTPWNARASTSISLGFPLHVAQDTTVYLRLRTFSNALLDVQVMPAGVAAQDDVKTLLWQVLYLGFILWVVLWAVQNYWFGRDRVVLIFALVYAVYLVYVLAIMGYFSPLFPDARLARFTSWFVVMATLSAMLFHRAFLLLFDVSRLGRVALLVLPVASFCALGLLLLDQIQMALRLNAMFGLLAAPVMFGVALTARKDVEPGLLKVRIYYGQLFVALIVYFMTILGWFSESIWSLYGAIIQGLVSAVLCTHLLYARSRSALEQQRQTEMRLKLSEQQLEIQRDQLNEQGRFTAMLAHELKNPLATIRINIDAMLRERDAKSPLGKRQQRIENALNDINVLVELCVLSDQIEQGKREIALVPVDCAHLVAECLERLSDQDQARIRVNEKAVMVLADPQLLTVVIANLLDNALKYSPSDSDVQLDFFKHVGESVPAQVQLQIRNQVGQAGLPDPAHLFDKYYRGQGTSRQNGTGLGLYLVKEIMAKLGGRVAYSSVNNTVIFDLWLPQHCH